MSGRSPFTNDAIWKGAVETLNLTVKESANKCGIGADTARQMRRVLRGQLGITPKMKPPPEIVAQIPYPDQQPLNPDVRATAAREVTAEANAASRINEVSPVVTRRKHKSRMTVGTLNYIAKSMNRPLREVYETLDMSRNMVDRWRKILTGEMEPGTRRLGEVSAAVISQIQHDFQTIPATSLHTAASTLVAPAPDSPLAPSTNEMNEIVDNLLALAERVEKLVPAFEKADEATKKLAALRVIWFGESED